MSKLVYKQPVVVPSIESLGPQPSFKGVYPSLGKQFLSTILTASGSSQNVAHGLGAVPAGVLVISYDNTVAAITEGAHDATNVKVTLTASAKFKVLAWL